MIILRLRPILALDFAWDDAKHEKILRERGFGFDFAAGIFDGDTVEDDRRDYGETRIRATGERDGFVLTVIYTDRDGVRRIISARLSNAKERRQWLGSRQTSFGPTGP
ncbi:hypothetical protein AFCDBAGC_3627 [Methylobacterium cerastii]|uniref:BrnT family toxin n=1 Tax=Methylobacterium cerastii TaxID=932741 RepID=A0ABQ4QKG7_9HYPH|nr:MULTISPECIES: BrnT family toxin [Methylobacterium]GJD45750.1 hypothetical protein AFCDBAGC_3627 [Methylobacterium cerastii]